MILAKLNAGQGAEGAPTPFCYMFGEEDDPRAIQGTSAVLEFVRGTEPEQKYSVSARLWDYLLNFLNLLLQTCLEC